MGVSVWGLRQIGEVAAWRNYTMLAKDLASHGYALGVLHLDGRKQLATTSEYARRFFDV